MNYEVEVKAKVPSLAPHEARLRAEGEPLGARVQEDVYFAPAGADPLRVDLLKGRVFRLRRAGAKAFVTFKRKEVKGGIEVSEETEFEVSDGAAVEALAAHLGYAPFIRKRKESTAYRFAGCRVELNRVAGLGDFVEIERIVKDEAAVAGARDEVRSALAALGIPDSAIEPRLYVDLLREQGKEDR